MADEAQAHLLKALSGEHKGQTFTLDKRTIIGRGGDTDIQLLDGQVSRHHALLVVAEGEELWVSDLSSANGTFVRGERVRQVKLEPGDEVRVGPNRFRYEIGPPQGSEQGTTEPELVKVLSGRSADATFRVDLATQQASPLHEPAQGRLEVEFRNRPLEDEQDAPTRVTEVPGCLDPLHATAMESGWRFCPACGGPIRR